MWKMSSIKALFVAVVIGHVTDIVRGVCSPSWKKKPTDPTYALKNEDVALEWEYEAPGCTINRAKWGSGSPSISRQYFAHGESSSPLLRYKDTKEADWKSPGTMILKNVTHLFELTYHCELSFLEGNQLSSAAFLKVVDSKPTLSQPLPDTRTEKEGNGPLTFEIQAESSPVPRIYWRKNDKPLVQSSNYEVMSKVIGQNSKNETIVKSSFTIKTVRRDDRAKFTARIAYGTTGPYIDTNMDFDVQYPPTTATFYTNLTSGITRQGESVLFTCTSDANPSPTYNIYKNSKLLMKSKSGVFVLKSVNASDSGKYECEPENSIRAGVRLDLNVTVIGSQSVETDGTDENDRLWLYVLIGCLGLLLLVLLLTLLIIGVSKKRRRKTKRIQQKSNNPSKSLSRVESQVKPKNSENGFYNPGYIQEQGDGGSHENYYIKQD